MGAIIMYKIPLAEIIQKITAATGMSKEAVEAEIKAKMDELSGLISEEGAAHILANELNVQLYQLADGPVKINDICDGMRGVDVDARVVQVYDVREFKTQSREGKVGNVLVEDETSAIRVTLWNDQADRLSALNAGDIVRIKGAYVRSNNRGYKELHMNDRSALVLHPPGVEIGEREKRDPLPDATKKQLHAVEDGDENIEVLATVVNAYKPNFYTRTAQEGEAPQEGHVMNVLLDDGTHAMRAACFGNQAERLLPEIQKVKDNPLHFESIKQDVLGVLVRAYGRAKKSDYSGDVELTITGLVVDPQLTDEDHA